MHCLLFAYASMATQVPGVLSTVSAAAGTMRQAVPDKRLAQSCTACPHVKERRWHDAILSSWALYVLPADSISSMITNPKSCSVLVGGSASQFILTSAVAA